MLLLSKITLTHKFGVTMRKERGGARKHKYPNRKVVQELFVYYDNGGDDEKSHGLCWRKSRGAQHAWKRAGCKVSPRQNKEPDRILVKINGNMFNVRDLIWIYHYGPMPDSGLKFEDGNCWNLRIDNIVPRKPVVSFM